VSSDNLGHPANETQAAFDFPQQKNACSGGDLAAVEVGLDLFPLDVLKKKPFGAKMIQGCFLLPCFCKRIVDQYVRRGNSFFYD